MKTVNSWKFWLASGLLLVLIACAPKRRETEFAKNKAADAGQTYTEEQLRSALGSAQYDQLIAGIGSANLNILAYGVGVSNMTKLMNRITGPGKLVALMSDGPNSKKMTAFEVLDFLNKLDSACQLGIYLPNGTDTIEKMAGMVNGVTLAGMEGIKNIVHGVQDQTNDVNGGAYTNRITRLGLLVALLDENASPSMMAQLINNVAAPSNAFSASGTAKLIRMVNETLDLWNLFVIIDQTTSVANITDVMLGLTGNRYCDFKPWYVDKTTCNNNGGTWINTMCTGVVNADQYVSKSACNFAGGTWTSDGIENMTQTINQLNKVCSNGTYSTAMDCRSNSATWYTTAEKIPVIVDNISNIPNMFTIVNGLTNDGAPYTTGTPDGVDTMVATLNNIYNGGMGDTGPYAIYGKNGVKRLAYLINKLDPSPQFGNDSDFENGGSCSNTAYETQAACVGAGQSWTPNAGFNCTTGNFDNRLNWAFSDNGQAAAPWNGKSFTTGGGTVHQGSCSLRNDNAAATALTATQSAELILNISTTGNMSFQHSRVSFGGGDVVRFFDNDVLVQTFSGNAGFAVYNYNITTTGIHRFRFDVHRAVGSTGQFFLDTVSVPGTKGAGRSAAQKTFIMMNSLYLANSITNVATLINSVSAPGCVTTPLSCASTNDNGLDTLIHVVNRSEYPVSLSTTPRLAITVNDIFNVTEMTNILNLNAVAGLNPRNQLVAMMDYVQDPANIPVLVNALGVGGGNKTASILTNISAAGTSNMLRILANTPAGAPIADTATLINGATLTSHIGTILNELPLSSNVNIAGVETFFPAAAGATGGVKLAQFFNQINTVSTANAQNCSVGPTPINSNFCIKNHLVRLVNDVAASANGPATISAIVGGMRPDTGGPGGVTGVVRMTNVMYYLKAMNATLYADPISTTTADTYGRLDTFIADLGTSGGATTARMVNEVDNAKLTTHVGSLIQNTNRIKYLSRFVSELTNVQLIIDIINGSPTIGRVQNLMNDMGDNTASNGNPATKYNNPDDYWATDNDKLGKVITFMNNITGGAANVVALLNGVTFNSDADQQKFPVLKDLVKGVHRIRYMTRILDEATSVNLIVALINASPDATRFGDLVNDFGDQTVGPGYGILLQPGVKYGANPSGANCATMAGFANGKGCDTNAVDKLGKVIVMLNEITAIQNTVDLMIQTEYFQYVKNLLLGVNRIRYLTYIVNNLTNVGLMIKVLNGADACTVYTSSNNTVATDTAINCTSIPAPAGPGVWSGVGRCMGLPVGNTANEAAAALITTKAACTTTATRVWIGAEQAKLLSLVNGVGNSELKGNVNTGDLLGAGAGTKPVGELFVLVDTMNKLGYLPDNVTPRSLGQQVRVVRVMNQVQYCGLKTNYDKRVQLGPSCVNGSNVVQSAYQHEEACNAAAASGVAWKAKYNNAGTETWVPASTMFNTCNDPVYDKPTLGPGTTGIYYADGDRYDGRNRILTLMLGVNDGAAFSIVVGDVQDTTKTVNMVNAVRRARALSQFLKWTPGKATAALINDTQPPAVLRSLVYLANNLEESEDATARAFASMVHFGTRMVAQGKDGGAATPNCLEFTGLGPRRLAAVLNLEAGPYLEGLVNNLGWQTSIAAMNCGWARDNGENNVAACSNQGWSGGRSGGMLKSVGSSYVGTPAPTGNQCVRSRETLADPTATFKTNGSVYEHRYGDYAWATNQGVRVNNCKSIMPEASGVSICNKNTDVLIWDGLMSVDSGIGSDGCLSGCEDMWSMLKGQGSGLIGSLMNSDSSLVGFPPPRVYSDTENDTTNLKGGTTTACANNSASQNNWACVREGLVAGDLRPNDGANMYYWGTYCAAGDADTPGSISGGLGTQALARSCITNGGTWKTEKNYQGPSCTLDPSAGPAAAIQPADMN